MEMFQDLSTVKEDKASHLNESHDLSIDSIDDKFGDMQHTTFEEIDSLLNEDEIVLDFLLDKLAVSFDENLLNGIAHECEIRLRDKHKKLDNIKSLLNETSNSLQEDQKTLRTVHNELAQFKRLKNRIPKNDSGSANDSGSERPQVKDNDTQDWVVDIELITDIIDKGWPVVFGSQFFATLTPEQKKSLIHLSFEPELDWDKATENVQREMTPLTAAGNRTNSNNNLFRWEGAVVAVVGLQDKGKTFILNHITNSTLPSGKNQTTKGLSFKHVDMDSTKLIILDTAGSYSPVKVHNEMSIVEKEATEMFLLDLVFDLADQFIFVVNEFTSLDQRQLDKLSRNLQHSVSKHFREIIVIHNLKEVENVEILDHIWANQVTDVYKHGSSQRTLVAAINPITGRLEEKHVTWFKTDYSRHICLANSDSVLGLQLNPWVQSLIRQWLKAVFVPVNRDLSIIESMIKFSNAKLINYFRQNIQITLKKNEDEREFLIVSEIKKHEKLKIPTINVDSHGFITARPDSFVPLIDIKAGEFQEIWLDMPGIKFEELTIERQYSTTIIRGNRRILYNSESNEITKQERKHGEFMVTLKIPDSQLRKFNKIRLEHGILQLKQNKDLFNSDELIESRE